MSPICDTVRKYPVKLCFLLLCIFLLSGFEVWALFSHLPAHEWNCISLEEIKVPDPANFSFAVFGDNRDSNSVFENLLKLIDHDPDMTFAMGLGDLVSDGKKQRYEYFFNQVRDSLALPLLTALGNHEIRGDGRPLYHEIFGPSYYSFQIGESYFIVLDDANGKGLNDHQIEWLEKELEKSTNYNSRIVFMNMPLYDPRGESHHQCLSKKASDSLAQLFAKYHVSHIFASHIPGYFRGRWKGISYTVTGGGGGALAGDDRDHYFFHFLKVHIKKGSIDVQVKPVPSPEYEWPGRFHYMVWLYMQAFLRFHGVQTVLLLIAAGLILVIYRSESRSKALSRKA